MYALDTNKTLIFNFNINQKFKPIFYPVENHKTIN